MTMKVFFRCLVLSLLLPATLLLAACGSRLPEAATATVTPAPSITVEPTALLTQTSEAYPYPVELPYPLPEEPPYPGPETGIEPGVTAESEGAYPPPPTLPAYPLPGSEPASSQPAYPEPPAQAATPAGQITQPGPTRPAAPLLTAGPEATEPVGSPAMAPPSSAPVTVSIWHSWSESEVVVLDDVLQAFQKVHPNVYFDVLYIPFDELFRIFQVAAYRGGGPSILLAPAEWGPELYDQGMVAAVDDLAVPAFLERINPAALEAARYRNALISLPHSIRRGVVMYRNRQIIPNAPATFDDLVSAAKAATSGGRVGAYLERGYFYSTGHLAGLGGQLMDTEGKPAFNDQTGLAWLDLLVGFERAGPVSFNTNRDLDLFKAGRVGVIIDGTWSREALVQAIGSENLAIDPWPAYRDGYLSGYLQTDNIFLAARATGDERYAALQFFGFMLAPEVQAVLTRADHIPALKDVESERDWMEPVMRAFLGGTAFPSHPTTSLYWDPLETAMGYVFNRSALPAPALKQASDTITGLIQDSQ